MKLLPFPLLADFCHEKKNVFVKILFMFRFSASICIESSTKINKGKPDGLFNFRNLSRKWHYYKSSKLITEKFKTNQFIAWKLKFYEEYFDIYQNIM
jgi:hypothetical protein